MRTLYWMLILVSTSGCASSATITRGIDTRGIDESNRMQEVILTHVPVGTPIDDAQRFMERESFTCTRMNSSDQKLFRDNEGRTCLDCDRSDGTFIYRRWRVLIVYQD